MGLAPPTQAAPRDPHLLPSAYLALLQVGGTPDSGFVSQGRDLEPVSEAYPLSQDVSLLLMLTICNLKAETKGKNKVIVFRAAVRPRM